MAGRKGAANKKVRHAQGEAKADIGFGSLLQGVGDFVGVLGKLVEAGEQQRHRSGEFNVKGLGEKAHGVYGVSVRVGIGGEPHVEPFGNIRSTAAGPEVVDVRAPVIDVSDEKGEIVVAVELPGVAEDSIHIDILGDVLAINSSGDRRYAKEFRLPSAVDATSLRRSFKNGLLELRLKKS